MTTDQPELFPEPTSAEPGCSICGQTDDYPGWWPENTEHVHIVYADCPCCESAHVCPDCLCERECCTQKEEEAEARGYQRALDDAQKKREQRKERRQKK